MAAADLFTVSSVSESSASRSATRAWVAFCCVCDSSNRVCNCHAQPQAIPATAKAMVSTSRAVRPITASARGARAGMAPRGAEDTASSRLAANEGISLRSSRDIVVTRYKMLELYLSAPAWRRQVGLFPLTTVGHYTALLNSARYGAVLWTGLGEGDWRYVGSWEWRV